MIMSVRRLGDDSINVVDMVDAVSLGKPGSAMDHTGKILIPHGRDGSKTVLSISDDGSTLS